MSFARTLSWRRRQSACERNCVAVAFVLLICTPQTSWAKGTASGSKKSTLPAQPFPQPPDSFLDPQSFLDSANPSAPMPRQLARPPVSAPAGRASNAVPIQGGGQPFGMNQQGGGQSFGMNQQGGGQPFGMNQQGGGQPFGMNQQGGGQPFGMNQQGGQTFGMNQQGVGQPFGMNQQGGGQPLSVNQQAAGSFGNYQGGDPFANNQNLPVLTHRGPLPSASPSADPAGALPQSLLGKWTVVGNCTKLEIRPDFADRAQSGFNQNSTESWAIKGKPGKYVVANSRGSQRIKVGQCNEQTAFFSYEHQINKTGVQQLQAVVLQLQPDGRGFSGVERITVSAPGEPSFRAQATYSLSGTKIDSK